jgi:uncharacterized YigZ family protein
MLSDEYQTILTATESLFKDKGSKFFGYAFPVSHEDEIKSKLEEIKTLHPKARHHCYAYKTGFYGENYRANDDGEPSGSAGKPILNVISSLEVTNTLVIVVRYFGGTLLGVPGLIHAYKEATKEALQLAEKEIFTINDLVKIEYDFDQTNTVMQMIKKLDLTVKEQTFDSKCGIILEVRKTFIEKIKEELKEYWTITIEVLD